MSKGAAGLKGRENNRWNGGLCIRDDGRAVICDRDGRVRYFYRVVMEAHLGRPLAPAEIVHHRNGDPSDDRIENLELMSRADHMRLHHPEILAARRKVREA